MPGNTAANEAWLTYLIMVEPCCDSLRALVIQLGGQLILELTSNKGLELVRDLIPSSTVELEPTLENLRTLAVPEACRQSDPRPRTTNPRILSVTHNRCRLAPD